jgi:SAM-dependent methyltransferase
MPQILLDKHWSDFYNKGRDFTLAASQDISRFLQYVDPAVPMTALDIGCGTGQLTRELYHRGYQTIGIDASSSAIKAARSLTIVLSNRLLYLHFNIERDDLSRLPCTSFGLITCKFVYSFIQDRAIFAAAVSRLLADGGLFVIATPLVGCVPPEKEAIAVNKDGTLGLLQEFFDVVFYEKGGIGYFLCRNEMHV